MIWRRTKRKFWIGHAEIMYLRVTWIGSTKINSIRWWTNSIDMWWLHGNVANHIWSTVYQVWRVSISRTTICSQWIVPDRHCTMCNRLPVKVMPHQHFQHDYQLALPNIWSKPASSHRIQHEMQQTPKMHQKRCSFQADSSVTSLNFTNTMTSKTFHDQFSTPWIYNIPQKYYNNNNNSQKKNNQTFALIQLQNINLLFQKNEEERKLY